MKLFLVTFVCSVVAVTSAYNPLVDHLLHNVDETVQHLKDQFGAELQKELSNLLNLGATFGKRNVFSSLFDASSLVNSELDNVKNVLYNYIHSVAGLLGNNHLDTPSVVQEMENIVAKHKGLLDGIVQQVNKGLAHLAVSSGQKRDLTSLFGGLAQQVSSVVEGVKQTLGVSTGSTGTVTDLGSSVLGAVATHLQNFGQTLSGLKNTAAGLLATGQETIDGLKDSASNLFHQTLGSAQGQASQVVDALLHPVGSK